MAQYRDFIATTLQEASEIARTNFGQVMGKPKAGHAQTHVLTETDLAVGKLIVDKITAAFPDHNIIDEEAGVIDNGSSLTWVIDPIDGTSSFAVGSPLYGIMIGLLEEKTPIAGGVSQPSLNELYVAEQGTGATLNEKPINVTSEPELTNVLVGYQMDSPPEDPPLTRREAAILGEIVLGIRNLRASNSCVDVTFTARGTYGGALNHTSKIWDNVALEALVKEAGGTYTTFLGKPIDYSEPLTKVEQNFTFCAAAPQLHSQLQSIIHEKF